MANEVRVNGIVSWTYPYFGNNHVMPYGVLLVTDGETEKACRTKGDRWDDGCDWPQIATMTNAWPVLRNAPRKVMTTTSNG